MRLIFTVFNATMHLLCNNDNNNTISVSVNFIMSSCLDFAVGFFSTWFAAFKAFPFVHSCTVFRGMKNHVVISTLEI